MRMRVLSAVVLGAVLLIVGQANAQQPPAVTLLFTARDIQVLGPSEQPLFSFTLPANTLSDAITRAMHIKMVGFQGNGDGGGVRVRGYIGAVNVWDTGDQYLFGQEPNPAWNFDWWSNVQTMLGPDAVWHNNVEHNLGGNIFGFAAPFYVNASSKAAAAGYMLKSQIDWTVDQTIKVTVQGTGYNEGWEGFVIATLEGQ